MKKTTALGLYDLEEGTVMCIPDVTFIHSRPDQSRHRITDNTYEYLMGYRRKGVGV